MERPAKARELALGWLARRPLTRREIEQRLERRAVEADEVERTLDGLSREGLLDDRALAYDFVVLRSGRLAHGEQRLVRDLQRRGVPETTSREAWRRAVEQGDIDPEELLRRAVARRLARESERGSRGRRRVYNALLRAGFPASEVWAELERQAPGMTPHEGE